MTMSGQLCRIITYFRVEFGLLVLAIAFPVSIFNPVTVTDYNDLIDIFQANPQFYPEYVRDALLYIVLPPAVGLALSILGFLRERKSPTSIPNLWIPLTVFGGIFFLWGILGLQWANASYLDAKKWLGGRLQLQNGMSVADLIQGVYQTASVGYLLWVIAGILFMLTYPFKEHYS